MANDMLNEKINDLFKSLMLESDIEEERKILKENGIDFNSEDLENFHKKKQELFGVLKENKKGLQKLSADDMSDVSGGGPIGLIIGALVNGAFTLYFGDGGWEAAINSASFSYVTAALKETVLNILSIYGYDEAYFAGVWQKALNYVNFGNPNGN